MTGPRRVLSVAFLAGVLGCSAPDGDAAGAARGLVAAPERDGRDVLLITVDTLRHDATGFSGAGRVETPHVDRLAAAGRVFPVAHAHAVVTLPSHASILTGLYPYQHGIRDNAGFVLPPEPATLATLLQAAGYRTAAFVSAFPLDRRFGLARGFEVYDDQYEGYAGAGFTPPERPGNETVSRALAWWDAHRGERRFLWVHVFTPHFPYEPGEPFASRYRDAPYFGDVALTDDQLAPLLEQVLDGPDGEALVIYTSDHGEALGEHGEQTHGLFAYEATLRVPLVIAARGLVEPARDDTAARHVDLLPTVLHLLRRDPPGGLPGRSLFAEPPPGHDRGSYFEALSASLNLGWAPLRGRLEWPLKALRLPIRELYRLDEDPGETANLAGRQPELLDTLLARLPAESLAAPERATLDEEQVARLRSLGYVASSGPASPPDETDPELDPKNLVRFDRMLDSALTDYRAGRVEPAIETLRRLIDQQPRMSLAYAHLAFFLTDLGRIEEAVAALQLAVARGASNESIHRKLALNLTRLGRTAEAAAVLAPHADSTEPETQSALGRIAAAGGRFDEARGRFRRALEIDSTYPAALMDLGTLLMVENRFDEARPLLEQALEQDPYLAEAWNGLGAIRARGGDPAGAIEAWRRAVRVDPRSADALYNLGTALARTGDRRGAAEALGRYARLVDGEERERAEAMLRELRR